MNIEIEIWNKYQNILPIPYSKIIIEEALIFDIDENNINKSQNFKLKKYPVELYCDFSLYKNISITNDED